MILNKEIANTFAFAVLVMAILLSILSFFIIKPVLKIFFLTKEASKQNAMGEFSKIDYSTKIVEISDLINNYNTMVIRMEEQFKQIKQFEKEKDEMIGNLSHDIKTPISSLVVLSQAMVDGILNESEKDYYIQSILDNCNRIASLSDELFQIVQSKNYLNNDNINEIWIDEILINVLNMFRTKIEFSKREVFVEGAENQKPLYLNESEIFRVLCNIIDNSLKYSQDGTPIKISIDNDIHFLNIHIQDFGQGIPIEEQKKIFNRTYRIEKSRNSKTGGHGLGLAISKQLIEKKGGTISVYSKVGKGSTFTIKIPYSHTSD